MDIENAQKVFFLVISARTRILNTIININTVITLNTIINMKVPTCRRRVPTLNIESSTWNFPNGIISSLIIQLYIIRVLHTLISSIV